MGKPVGRVIGQPVEGGFQWGHPSASAVGATTGAATTITYPSQEYLTQKRSPPFGKRVETQPSKAKVQEREKPQVDVSAASTSAPSHTFATTAPPETWAPSLKSALPSLVSFEFVKEPVPTVRLRVEALKGVKTREVEDRINQLVQGKYQVDLKFTMAGKRREFGSSRSAKWPFHVPHPFLRSSVPHWNACVLKSDDGVKFSGEISKQRFEVSRDTDWGFRIQERWVWLPANFVKPAYLFLDLGAHLRSMAGVVCIDVEKSLQITSDGARATLRITFADDSNQARKNQEVFETVRNYFGDKNSIRVKLVFLNSQKYQQKTSEKQQAPADDSALTPHYAILGVSSTADRTTVKRAYNRLSQESYPDFHPEGEKDKWTAKQADLNGAWEAISKWKKKNKIW